MGYRTKTLTAQGDTFVPPWVLPIEQAQVIFDMLDAGCTLQELYDEHLAYMKVTNKAVRPVIAKMKMDDILLNKWRYCPDIDEVAVERAYDGDKEVWQALTHYERLEVLARLHATWLGDKPHRRWPGAERGNGIVEWSASVDENPDRIYGLRRLNNGSRRRRA